MEDRNKSDYLVDWKERHSAWRTKWLDKFPLERHQSIVVVNEVDRAEKWWKLVSQNWDKKVVLEWIERSVPLLPVPLGLQKHADVELNKGSLLLVNRRLFKMDILRRECVFQRPVWMLDFTNVDVNTQEYFKYHPDTKTRIFMYPNKEVYFEKLEKWINSSLIKLQYQQQKEVLDSSISIQRSVKMINTAVLEKRIEFYKRILLEERKMDAYFQDEDWDQCRDIPESHDYLKGFIYTASPLFLDVGDCLYVRKFTPNSIGSLQNSPVLMPYLKRVSYQDFMRWAVG